MLQYRLFFFLFGLVFLLQNSIATGLDEAIKNGTTTGLFRLAWIKNTPEVSGSNTTMATAFGGKLKLETRPWQQWQFALAPFFSEKVIPLSGNPSTGELNGDFFDSDGNSFAYLGEAYLHYAFTHGSLRLGRQQLDNPFLNIDEIHILPNTFTAAWLKMALTPSLQLDSGVVTHWAGFDSGQSIDSFKPLAGNGAFVAGLNYSNDESLSLQGWFYHFDREYSLLYADISYTLSALQLAAQLGHYTEINASGTAGDVIGFQLAWNTGAWTLGTAINAGYTAAGKSLSNGLGGGSFYTSIHDTTIEALENPRAWLVSVDYALSAQFTASIIHGHFKGKVNNINEVNLVLRYHLKENFSLDFTAAWVKNNGKLNEADTNFNRGLLRASYNF